MTYLVADIGGTHARFALAEGRALRDVRRYENDHFETLEAAIAHYLTDTAATCEAACIAIAGPVTQNRGKLTNRESWVMDGAALAAQFSWRFAQLVNDFVALAAIVPDVEASRLTVLQNGEESLAPKVVIGPGTGLGVAAVLHAESRWHVVASEAGNTAFAPATAESAEWLEIAWRRQPYIRSEDFISGRGLGFLHDCRIIAQGGEPTGMQAEAIYAGSVAGEVDCQQTLRCFSALLGSFASDIALSFNAQGGVYLCGNILEKLGSHFDQTAFMNAFTAKGDFTTFIEAVPVYRISSRDEDALAGAASLM
ncbi:MAG: hypothetical protein CMM93_07370 [Rickettsiales bacterium]|nr:hypothetical protein [Rickettsiales bacterium]|tara:strand:- start:31 stop:960 length:930 start_codon:yes stop_codon:yes gene_type:complete